MPRAVDPLEPEHVAIAAAELGLEHIVVTSVDRDDLPDGGASQFVKVIEALRRDTPDTTIEILTPDFRNKHEAAVEAIVAAGPDVYNHNLETVPRLYPTIRPGARYYASLRLLESVKTLDPQIFTKSGMMVGLGEQRLEVHQVMDDMRSAGIDFLTMGQYLQPTPRHAKVEEFVTPRGVQGLCRDRPGQGLPAGRGLAADPVELSRRRRFPGDAGGARGAAGERAARADAAAQRDQASSLHARPAVRPRRRRRAAMTNSCRGWSRCGSGRRARPRWSPTWSSASTPSRSGSPAG